ncbi:MAG: hypothetical protein ACOYIQ_00760 [Christensenellales bacterium]|jgi:hypothetical protein
MNWGNIIGIGGYLLLLSGAIYKLYKDKKAGKSKCYSCPARGECMRNTCKAKENN